MKNQVYKIHSDFYYVKISKNKIYTCKLKETIKKEKKQIVVGDFVELDKNCETIISLKERKNFLLRPKASNIDLALVVCALKNPDLDFIQLNRYLIFLKYHNIDCAICFNKEDLAKNLEEEKGEIRKIYEPLGYKIFFTSAKDKKDLDKLQEFIKNKTTVLCGQSGVGKSTLLNALNPEIFLRTKEISKKTNRGVHTTRHCEIVEFQEYKIMDTPGFSCLKFDFLLPNELVNLFSDISPYAKNCKFSNCYHEKSQEDNCEVIKNLDKIAPTRYESYLCFLKESLEYKKEISKRSIKEEENSKNAGDKKLLKISKRKREASRNTQNQQIKKAKRGKYD